MPVSKKFLDEYGSLSTDIGRANGSTFLRRIKDWVHFLRSSPESSAFVRQLEDGFDFTRWYGERLDSVPGEGGLGDLDLAADRRERLREYWGLFNGMAESDPQVEDFSRAFVSYSAGFDELTQDAVQQHFVPFMRDLRKTLDDGGASNAESVEVHRVVFLDHTSHDYRDLMDKLSSVVNALETSNSARSVGEDAVERNLAEMKAGMDLLLKRTARPHIVQALLIASLTFSLQLVGNVAGEPLVKDVLRHLQKVLGITIPGAD